MKKIGLIAVMLMSNLFAGELSSSKTELDYATISKIIDKNCHSKTMKKDTYNETSERWSIHKLEEYTCKDVIISVNSLKEFNGNQDQIYTDVKIKDKTDGMAFHESNQESQYRSNKSISALISNKYAKSLEWKQISTKWNKDRQKAIKEENQRLNAKNTVQKRIEKIIQ